MVGSHQSDWLLWEIKEKNSLAKLTEKEFFP